MESGTVDETFLIQAESYTQKCQKISKNFVKFERQHVWPMDTLQIDVFGPFWSIALIDQPPVGFYVASGKDSVPIVGRTMFYIPPFSLIEWHIPKCTLHWHGYLLNSPVPLEFPLSVAMFKWSGKFFESESEIHQVIRSSQDEVRIRMAKTASRTAIKTKVWLDAHFGEEILKIQRLASELGVSLAYISREFKICYGISPKTYLNKIRSYTGMALLLLDNTPVGEASARVGYLDPRGFYEHFTKEFRAVPSAFQNREGERRPPVQSVI